MKEIQPKKNAYKSRIDDPEFYSREEVTIERVTELVTVFIVAIVIVTAIILTMDHYNLLNWLKL